MQTLLYPMRFVVKDVFFVLCKVTKKEKRKRKASDESDEDEVEDGDGSQDKSLKT